MARFLVLLGRETSPVDHAASTRPTTRVRGTVRGGVDVAVWLGMVTDVMIATSTLPARLPAIGTGTAPGAMAATDPQRWWVTPWSPGVSSDVVAALWPVMLGEAAWSEAGSAASTIGERAGRLRSRTDRTVHRATTAMQIGRKLDVLDDLGTRWRTAGIGLVLVVTITGWSLFR